MWGLFVCAKIVYLSHVLLLWEYDHDYHRQQYSRFGLEA